MMDPTRDHPRELISAWLDGEILPEERATVEEHIAACAECRVLVEDLRRLAQASAEEEIPPVPAELAAKISWRLRSVAKEGERFRRSRLWTIVPMTAAASLAAIALLIVVVREQGTTQDAMLRPQYAPPRSETIPEMPREEESRSRAAPPAGKKSDDRAAEGKVADRFEDAKERSSVAARREPTTPLAKAERQREDQPSFAPAPPEPQSEPAGAIEGGASSAPARDALASRRAEADDERASNEKAGAADSTLGGAAAAPSPKTLAASACRAPWDAHSSTRDGGFRVRGDSAERALRDVVAGSGGTITPDGATPHLYRIDVPTASWSSVRAALRDLGVAGLDSDVQPPAGTDCVRLTIEVLP